MTKVLGQVAPNATTPTDLYVVPTGYSAVCSTLVVCNRGAEGSFRVSVAVANEADANKQYLYYDVVIPTADTLTATVGLTLAETDVVRVYASSANMSFSLFGMETAV